MNRLILIVLLLTGTSHINKTRGEQNNNKTKEIVPNTTEEQTEVIREGLRKVLDPNLPDVTNQTHDEVKQLNTLITSAVSKNAYSSKHFRSPDENIMKLNAHNLIDASPSVVAPLLSPTTNIDDIAITHNIIESNFITDFLNQTTNTTIWHPNLIATTHLSRELLKLNSIEQNFNYNFENFTHIKLWKLIKINGTINLIVGLRQSPANNGSQLLLITEIGFNFKFVRMIAFPKVVNKFDIVKSMSHKYLVTIENETIINFYKIEVSNGDYDLVKVNEIDLHKVILELKFFCKNLDKIRLVFVTEYDSQFSADLYEFEFTNSFNFWLINTMPLTSRCHRIAILDTGRDYIVAFPQINEVVVYQYKNNSFTHLDSIETNMVTDVSGFSMGGYSYLAVGGHNPQILRYHRGQLHPQSMLSQSFGLVEQWFPISARTHRDDLLLLVQHRINYSTHSVNVLEALIWDGETFNNVPTTPCYRNEIISKYGITCMIDIEQETEIAGSVIIQHGKNISILVPRGEEASQLFNLNIELVPVPNPLQQDINEFNSIYKILATLVENFDSSIQQIQNAIDNAVRPEEYTVVSGNWEIEMLEFENTFVDSDIKIGTAFVGDTPISKRESEMYLSYMEDILDGILEEFVESNHRRKREETTPETNIQFEFLNGIPADKLLFSTEDPVELVGIQQFESSIYVENDVIMSGDDSKINGISIRNDTINSESEVVLPAVECDQVEILENLHVMNDINGKEFNQENMGRLLDDGTRNTIIVEDMIVGGDLNFSRINKVDFDNFLNKIIFKNIPNQIVNLSIDGNIFAETEFGLKLLNDIPFPDGFMFRNSTSQQEIIHGHKVFTQSLVTNEIDTDGEINGIKPSDVVTLGDDQFIPGEITFSHIEVTESFELNGTITGQNLDTFLTNPTLTQTNVINSSCVFEELHVHGNVYLVEIEHINLDKILQNIVYTNQSNEFVNVNSLKLFDVIYVETDFFTITSNSVNNQFSLDNYVTKSDSQILNVKYLSGAAITLNTITLTGLFNGINVTELDLNSIKTVGDQYIEKRVKFQHPIVSKHLKILEQINKKSISLLIDTKHGENVRINSNFEIENLEIEYLTTNGNIQSKDGFVNEINLNEFDRVRFSLSQPQTIPGKFLVVSATVDGDLHPIFLNDVSMKNFNELIENKKNTVSDIFSGKVTINNIIVTGNVTVNYINGFNMDKILQNVIWLDRPSTISNRLTFLDKVVMYSDLEVLSQVNSKYNLNAIFDQLVYRDQSIDIKGKKVFAKGIQIHGDLVTENINDVAVDNLILSNHLNRINNKIIINGNLQVNHLNGPYINDLAIGELTSLYHFDEVTKTHHLNYDHVQFVNTQKTSRLHVNGSINDLFNVNNFLENIVQLDGPIHFDGNLKLFQHYLIFAKNLIVKNFNSIDLENYFDHLVHIDEKDPVFLRGDLEFRNEITIDHMRVGGNLITNTILGYDLNEWLKNDLFINENVHVQVPLKFERGTFYAAAMGVRFLNNINMSKVLTYNTEQEFDDDFHVAKIVLFVPVRVSGLVNQINLTKELKNTFMLTGNTSIQIPLRIIHLGVQNAIKTPHLINDKSITDIITIEPHMVLPQSISFDQIHAQSIMVNHQNISGIDFELWYMQSLWKRGRETQTVLTQYTISNVAVGEGGIHGTGIVNNKSMNEIVETRSRVKLKLENELLAYGKEVEFICMHLKHSIQMSKQQIYYVKYFDDRIILNSRNSKITTKLFFAITNETYLLISGTDCHTTIYKWETNLIDFVEVLKFKSGFVKEWGQLYSKTNEVKLVSHLITNNGSECTKTGVYLWKFNGHTINEILQVLLHPEYEIKSLWTSHKFVNNLFLITEGTNREPNVFQIDGNGKINNQWKLPINYRKLQFLPVELIFHLALSDGSQIFLINDDKTNGNRVKRHTWEQLKELFKSRHDKLLSNTDSGILKLGLKRGKNFKRGLLDLGNKQSLVDDSQVEIPTTTTPVISVPFIGRPLKSIPDTIEKIIDSIFNKIVKVSDKSIKSVRVNGPDTVKVENVIEDVSHNFVTSTIDPLSKVQEEEVGDPLVRDDDSLISAIALGYPHVRNISKSLVVATANAVTHFQKFEDRANSEILEGGSSLKSVAANTLNNGYESLDRVTNDLIDTTVNIVSQTEELANKFEWRRDDHDAGGSNITERDTHEPQQKIVSNSNTTGNGSMVGLSLDTAYTKLEDITKKIVDAAITNVANLEDFKDAISHPKTIGAPFIRDSNPDEFVIAPNPSYTTVTPVVSKIAAKNSSNYNIGSNVFNTFRRLRIGEKQTKIRTLQTTDSHENTDTIGQEITYNGVIASENSHIPEKGTGEIVLLHVGGNENRRMLTAVSIKTNASTIPGKHDTIKIYDDILEGKIYQEIHASKPTGLTAIHIGDQTMLAFLEDQVVIQLFIFHGIEGFKHFNEYKLPMIANHLSSRTLSRDGNFSCPRHFLIVTFPNKLWFLEAIMEGNCGVDTNLNCTLPL